MSSGQFSNLRWNRLVFNLVSTEVTDSKKTNLLSVVDAIVKEVTNLAGLQTGPNAPPHVLFHLNDKRSAFNLERFDSLQVETMFVGCDLSRAQQWKSSLATYFSTAEASKTLGLVNVCDVEERTYQQLEADFAGCMTGGEICLDFLTPLPFKVAAGRRRTFLTTSGFINLFLKRFSRLFGIEFKIEASGKDFTILPYYWKYVETRRGSKSQPGTMQYINGCVGKLYIKGTFGAFLPLMILGSELHAGSTLANSLGYYKLLKDSPGYFENFFPRKQSLLSIIREVMQKYDHAAEQLAEEGGFAFEEKAFAEKLTREIADGSYQPSPNRAFLIDKQHGGRRLVEQLAFRDLIVQEYLLQVLSEVAERIFEAESIGFRKGLSRHNAVEMVQEAIAQGYRHVIEADIEDFFPSIELDLLGALLDRCLPAKDNLIKALLSRSYKNGYVLAGAYHARDKGLAQGSPLSPLLANLYLDSFDEAVAGWGVKLIRYADDFVILTKSHQEAEAILTQAESLLSHLGLKLKKDKTCIKPIEEGFQFLGIKFTTSGAEETPEEQIHLYRKPLYLTEPFLFLAVNGDALEIRKDRQLVETIPFRRVSEIMAMEKTTFSTALIRKCTENNIPLTITLGSGYYITTIKPDSKKYYNTLYAHTAKYASLGDTEILAIAKEIATTKLKNYMALFQQRYKAGQNLFLKELEELARKIDSAADVDQVRGLEGRAARQTYQQMNDIIEVPCFRIQSRERKNPDRINSLMNFSSYLLFSRLNATVRAAGLNPYLGFLHCPEDNYESLVSDLVEVFRARMDRFLVRMINLKVIAEGDFTPTDRGLYLSREAIKKFLAQFEREMEKKGDSETLSLKENVYVQVQVLKRWALENGSLSFYAWQT